MFPIRDHNPSERTPYVTICLIIINIVMFVLTTPWLVGMTGLWEQLALYPVAVVNGYNLWGLFSHMFLHAGILHIAGNMLFLWVFGDNLEDQMGHVGFLIFYLLSGLAAAAAQIASNPLDGIPMVGASGAIAGVMGGYLLLFPKARVDVLALIIIFIKIFTIPAWVMLGLWFLFQIFGSFSLFGGDNVAYWAHAGGFVAGAIFALPIFFRLGGLAYWSRTHGRPPHPAVSYSRSRIPQVRR
ncbi:rhomboid family intramembrane serine protease [Paracoccus aerodenitrificans]|uniref:rhomboid family intramembrane serine protease n=1 Tax=Paracoccus aerodenitrificans TaxID=3017781 RepID=UPI0022F0E1B8|nr:rhomboid family intramembrane serine protease [Paracoccus aerodenitrificans]WBU63752.1 rhomboid family intramembrane serine protease [Paracoccus aerodenitrificans]